MKSKLAATLVIAYCTVGLSHAVEARDQSAHKEAPALERFAKLEGEWIGKGMHGDTEQEVRVVYKVTSGGSAVVETMGPDTDHEMVTVIHPDGDSLLLTHYCMLGNQPQMRAKPKPGDNQVAFEFVRATNLASDKDMYMRSVTFTFVDQDTLKTEWTNYTDGKEAGKSAFEFKRQK